MCNNNLVKNIIWSFVNHSEKIGIHHIDEDVHCISVKFLCYNFNSCNEHKIFNKSAKRFRTGCKTKIKFAYKYDRPFSTKLYNCNSCNELLNTDLTATNKIITKTYLCHKHSKYADKKQSSRHYRRRGIWLN